MDIIQRISHLVPIFLTITLFVYVPHPIYAADTEVEDVEAFEELETPSSDEAGGALGEMESMVQVGGATVDDAEAETKRAKQEAELAEKQLADAQKRLNEMKLYKASLAQKTKQDVAEAEKRKQAAEKEKAALDSQRRVIETEIAEIQKQQRKLEAVEKAARLKAEKAKAKLLAAKEKRSQKRKATTKVVPTRIKKNTIDSGRKQTAQQARI